MLNTTSSRYNLKRRVASLPPISSEVFTEKVLQARAVTTAEEDKAGFNKSCDTCQKTYYSENSYKNHISSAKHKARVTAAARKPVGKADDGASTIMSSTLSLGDPAEAEVDSDAEEEFNEVVESLKKTGLNEQTSPVRRPSNPHPSAAGQHKDEHPVSVSTSEEPSASTTPSTATPVAKTNGPVPTPKTCLFCSYESPTAPLNVLHMERIHGMFIPEKQYLVDPEGLLAALQQRVFELNECLNCGKIKANAFAVQTHMRDKGHCKIPYDTEEEQLEIGEFYDFRSTYSDADEWESEDEEMEDAETSKSNAAKLGAKRSVKITGDGTNDDGEGDGWETDSSASSLDSDDLHAVPAEKHYHQYERLSKHPHHSRDDQRAHHQRDGWHAHNHRRAHAVFYDDYELHLPSGRSVGHRSLNRYFRQNLHSHPSPEERAERLALEAAEAENAMDVDGEERQGRRADGTHGRALISREARGLGAADPNSAVVQRVVLKGRKKEFEGLKGKDLEVSRMYFKQKHRNHASYLR